MDDAFVVLFLTLFVSAIVWIALVQVLFYLLKKNHPSMYESLQPSGSELNLTMALFRFLVSRRPESLKSPGLRALANFMRLMYLAFVAGFIWLVYLAFGQSTAA